MSLEKLQIFHTAAMLTLASAMRAGPAPGGIPVDATNQEPLKRAVNLETWEEERVYFAALEGALADDTNWAPPNPGAAPAPPSALLAVLAQPAIVAAIASNPVLAPLATLLKITQTVVAPVPLPATLPIPPVTTGS